MIDQSKYVMSKYATREELLKDKCEAYKEELEKSNKLLTKAHNIMQDVLYNKGIYHAETYMLFEDISNYLNESR